MTDMIYAVYTMEEAKFIAKLLVRYLEHSENPTPHKETAILVCADLLNRIRQKEREQHDKFGTPGRSPADA